MKKIIFLLVAASLFIAFVMFHVMKNGVRIQEQLIIKWSSVESPEKAGAVVARHLYPLLEMEKDFFIEGSSDFAKKFHQAFAQTLTQEKVNTDLHQGHPSTPSEAVTLKIDALQSSMDKKSCQQGDRYSCLQIRALRKFNKKERDPQQLWIQMWRVSKNQIQLFYH